MRVLLYPVFNQHVLKTDSIYHTTEALARHLVEVHGWVVHWVVPEPGENPLVKYKVGGTMLAPNAKVPENLILHRRRAYTSYRLQEVTSPEWLIDEFHPLFRSANVIDAVITTSAIHGLYLRQLFQEAYNRMDMVPVFSYDQFLRGSDTKEVTSVGEAELITQILGLCFTHAIYESPYAKQIALTNARKYLKPTFIRKLLEDTSDVIPVGADFEKVDQHLRTDKYEGFKLYFGGRVTPSKGVPMITEVADYLYKMGSEVQIEVTTGLSGTARNKELLEPFSNVNARWGLSQEDSFKVMGRCHAFICASRHELFGKAFWEQMYAGLIGIFRRADWNKELLPPDYPLVFDTMPEAYALLKDVQDNYDAWKERLAWVPAWVKEQYDHRNTYSRLAERITHEVTTLQREKVNPEGELYKAIVRGARRFKGTFTVKQLEEELVKMKLVQPGGLIPEGNPARLRTYISRYKIHRILVTSGEFRDVHQGADLVYERL